MKTRDWIGIAAFAVIMSWAVTRAIGDPRIIHNDGAIFLAWGAIGISLVRFILGIQAGIFEREYRHRLGVLAHAVCAKCGYDLRATPARCPECGTVPAPAAVLADDSICSFQALTLPTWLGFAVLAIMVPWALILKLGGGRPIDPRIPDILFWTAIAISLLQLVLAINAGKIEQEQRDRLRRHVRVRGKPVWRCLMEILGIATKRMIEASLKGDPMLKIKPEYWTKGRGEQFVVLSLKDFEKVAELIEDAGLLRILRQTKRREADAPTVPLAQVRRLLGTGGGRLRKQRS